MSYHSFYVDVSSMVFMVYTFMQELTKLHKCFSTA